MSPGRRSLLLAALGAVVGGGAVAGVVAVTGLGAARTTTIVQQAPLRAAATATARASAAAAAPTARSLFERDAPSVVQVRAEVVRHPEGAAADAMESTTTTGSGFAVDARGSILTAAHVVAGAVRVLVTLDPGRVLAAEVVGRDADSDLALLKVDPGQARLRPLPLGTDDTAQVGDPVVAIANPYGSGRTLTQGVVSGRQSAVRSSSGVAISDVVQTDAAVDPGGSGGPLLDAAGRVIGVATRLGDGDDAGDETCFAIPVDTAARVLAELDAAQG